MRFSYRSRGDGSDKLTRFDEYFVITNSLTQLTLSPLLTNILTQENIKIAAEINFINKKLIINSYCADGYFLKAGIIWCLVKPCLKWQAY